MSKDFLKQNMDGNQPQSLLLRLLLSPFDALTEVDLNRRKITAIRTSKGKFFAPIAAGEIEDMLSYTVENMVHPDDREVFVAANNMDTLWERLEKSETPGVLRSRYRYKLLDGGWCRVERVYIGGERFGLPKGVVYAFVFDIEQQRQVQERLLTAYRRSELTGLLGKDAFFAAAKRLLEEKPGDWRLTVFDLEQFKLFNEWYGREKGDMLLAKIGARLSRIEERGDGLAGYFGQDDFALLATYDMQAIGRLYEEIHELVKEHGTSVGFMPAFGVSRVEDGVCVEELYDRSALAARHAKQDYHKRIREYEPSMYEQTDRDYRVLSDFQYALKNHELYIVLQPQCRIDDGKIVGAESLIRWTKEDGTVVPPSVFVPALERYGFVTDLDRYVWNEVFAWAKSWVARGNAPLPVSVNVSRIDIYTIDVPEYFEHLREYYDLPLNAVKIEIAESAYVDNTKVAGAVHRLREKGFTVLMDDFGSGYSSLNMLRSLNVDIIKLDAQFLRMDSGDSKGLHIMESIVNMAKTMGVPIIVEGVENATETEYLTGLGCRYVQGYYFYRPMSVEDFEALVSDGERVDTGGFRLRESEQLQIREFLDQNVFSDAMLNNILGPVAFFRRSKGTIDLVRLNQQFREELGVSAKGGHAESVQRMVEPEDLPMLYGLLDMAAQDPLSGAAGEIGVVIPGVGSKRLQLRIFFIDEDEPGKMFYASVHDVTQLTKLNEYMQLMARLSIDTVAFVFREDGAWRFRVAVHGLEKYMGLSREAFERELNSGSFRTRIDPASQEMLRRSIADSGMSMEHFSDPFDAVLDGGGRVTLRLRVGAVLNRKDGAEYTVVFHKG
ncbi:MAG: EAL domain-containing protein [Oscillospiraceae bacterium]|nr:EAL domain-containing protein [Oscillospiraceae bacterium]